MLATRHWRTTYAEHLQKLVDEYAREHGAEEIDLAEVAQWAIDAGRWEPRPRDAVKSCRRELAQALREEYYIDPQGREVRKKHPIRIKRDGGQLTLWADIETANPRHMRLSLQQRRRAILADCRQHKTDADSYNDNNLYGAQLTFDYDFNADLREESMPTEYPDERPG